MSDEPQFGNRLGFLFPLTYKILGSHKHWSPSMWLPHNAIATDIYISSWWLLELISILLLNSKLEIIGLLIIIFFSSFRYIDLMFVLSSILVKGFYKKQDLVSAHRITLLVVFNAIEIMVLFAILYRGFSILTPEIAITEPPINSFFDAMYLSVITGTSIGFGIPTPIGWLSKLLTMLEGSSVVLVVIAVIGYISNEKSKEIKK